MAAAVRPRVGSAVQSCLHFSRISSSSSASRPRIQTFVSSAAYNHSANQPRHNSTKPPAPAKLISTSSLSSTTYSATHTIPRLHIGTNRSHHKGSTASSTSNRAFSTSAVHQKRGARPRLDSRVRLIRYHLGHPKLPRPLRFSRLRALRHWTIHRAWQLHRSQQRTAEQLSLERQYNCMRQACEALRLTGEDGLSVPQPGKALPPPGIKDPLSVRVKISRGAAAAAAGGGSDSGGKVEDEMIDLDVLAAAQQQKEVGRLFRIAMMKDRGVMDSVPIEYARAQTETPPRNGWDHNWTR